MQLSLDQFYFYQKAGPVRRTRRDLPHWQQEGVCAFVTLRLVDSLPESVLGAWAGARAAWLRAHGIDPACSAWRDELEVLAEDTVAEFHRTFTQRLHELLDAGHGGCFLRLAEARKIAEKALMHWQGERYLLAGWVIMPNHLHVLVQPLEGYQILHIGESWKRFTAREINRLLSRRGHFWQGEGWDHLLRSAVYLRKYRRYIRGNPVKAGIMEGDFTLWLPEIVGLKEA